ncbi:MAG: hypothetical protein DRH37_07805 [Deltaproteobacteria bacterium]|nr:MAG: hypothetical protein DRH37_07805 [Deltaproteobacteria bacterium]
MTAQSIIKKDTTRSLRRLMFLRVVVVTFLLGVAGFIQIKGTQQLAPPGIPHVFSIIIVIYFLSLLYVLIFKSTKNLKINIYAQALCDIVIVTALVYVTGGIESVYSVLYQLVIIYSALFLGRKGGLVAASACSLLYGLMLDFEYYTVLPVYGSATIYNYSAGYVLSRIFIHVVSFYIVALLVSFVVEQEKRSRSLLTEKESEFDRLDLFHKSIIENVNAGIITTDLMGNIKSFNRTAAEISGYTLSEVKDRPIDDFFPGIFEMMGKVKGENTKGNLTKRGEIVVSDRNNREIVLGFSVSSLMSSSDERIGDIVIFQDLTATKDMEKEVEKSKNLALIGEMAAGLAHEIRNPLTAVSGSIQLLRRNLDLDETDSRLMNIILRGRDQLENLISNFLLLARPNMNDRVEMALETVMDEVIESLRYSPEWNDETRVKTQYGNTPEIFGNRTEIKQMIWNLVLNAVQAMPDGGTLNVKAEEIVSDDGKPFVEICISDTGHGIEKDNEERIFTPFYTTKERGTGLGLAIANRIAESHGGKIRIWSEVGKGTFCRVRLPLRSP